MADPSRARAMVTEALQASQGNVTHAARALQVSHRQLCRVIARMGLGAAVEAIRCDYTRQG